MRASILDLTKNLGNSSDSMALKNVSDLMLKAWRSHIDSGGPETSRRVILKLELLLHDNIWSSIYNMGVAVYITANSMLVAIKHISLLLLRVPTVGTAFTIFVLASLAA